MKVVPKVERIVKARPRAALFSPCSGRGEVARSRTVAQAVHGGLSSALPHPKTQVTKTSLAKPRSANDFGTLSETVC